MIASKFPSRNGLASAVNHNQHVPGQPQNWLEDFINHVDMREASLPITPVIQTLQDLIESRTDLRMWASAMFQEVPNKIPYNTSISSGSTVRGYRHMIELLNVIVTEVAPTWTMSVPAFGLTLIGLPFQAIFNWPMGTPSGHAFFLNHEVNAKLKAVLDYWRDSILATSKSLGVITTGAGGWLSEEAIAAIEQTANLDSRQWYTFEELFHCDPQGDPIHWGFKSWDDFFVRRFKDMDSIRPVGYPNNPAWVVNACESRPVALKGSIKQYDRFWLKSTNYSVADMLGHHELADNFIGGTVHQSVLKTTAYHRWHSPVSGCVVFAKVISGAYFSERSTNGLFSDPILPPQYDQVYLSHVATRAVIFIQAEEPVGLMCFVAIGIADVSTCEIASKFSAGWPQPVAKGEEIGMFHYGGSSQCLLFRKSLKLAFTEGAVPGNRGMALAIRSPLAFAHV
ncbi:phosphatidylserine decarboxylase family protein [Mariannaea sp. PMI_226]|nr:phosphatidylserine decarboxylase family protein [Mariannaea sp. PMI_226]